MTPRTAKRITTATLPVEWVERDPQFQPRTESGATDREITRMRAAGRANGHTTGWDPSMYDPIRIWRNPEGRYLVFEGFHRLALAEACGIDKLEVRLHQGHSHAEIVALADRSNIKTRPHEPLEEAAIYARAAEGGASWEEVSQRYDRRHPGYYERRAALHYLCPELKTSLRDKHLKVEYAEVIGRLAKAGASVPLQLYLRDLAWTSKVRVEVFRILGEELLRKGVGRAESVALFDVTRDAAVLAAQRELERVTGLLKTREAWTGLARAGQAVLRAVEDEELPEVSDIVAFARLRAAAAFGADPEGESVDEAFALASEVEADTLRRAAKPLVKWVGGKAWALPWLAPLARRGVGPGGRLVEPFGGGGALTLGVVPERGVYAEAVPDLVALYAGVKSRPGDVARALADMLSEYGVDKDGFLRCRKARPELVDPEDANAKGTVQRGAWLIYVNRLGFNGIFGVNLKGGFNCPYGDGRTKSWPTEGDFASVSRALRGVEVRLAHGTDVIGETDAVDFIYADPPHDDPKPSTRLVADPRFKMDHDKLAIALRNAVERGAAVAVSLPDTDASRSRYGEWTRMYPVTRSGRAGGGRKGKRTSELLALAGGRFEGWTPSGLGGSSE